MQSLISLFILAFAGINVVRSEHHYTGDITSYGAMPENQFCGFKKNSWNYNGLMTAAINNDMIDNSITCGMCAAVTYGDKSTVVLLDNLCPECKHGDLDLSHEAWNYLTNNKNYGREKAKWSFIDCDKFIIKDGEPSGGIILKPHHINYWWLAITPSNMKCGVSSIDISFEGKEWISMERDNGKMNGLYFIFHSQVVGSFRFKLTSRLGEELITDTYNSIDEIYYTKKQFKCDAEVDCGLSMPSEIISNVTYTNKPSSECSCK